MIRARMVPVKQGISALMIAPKEADIKSEDLPAHMRQGKTSTKQKKHNDKTPTVMVHDGQINEATTICLPMEKDWSTTT